MESRYTVDCPPLGWLRKSNRSFFILKLQRKQEDDKNELNEIRNDEWNRARGRGFTNERIVC
jgi:hypothetical protein